MEDKKVRKLRHYFLKGQIYFVTSNTKDRKEIFKNRVAARFFATTIAYHKYVLNFYLFGYVIMPDHFHLLLQPCEEYSLSKIMNYIKGNFARKYNEFINPDMTGIRPLRVGYHNGRSNNSDKEEKSKNSVWQKEYYEYVIRDEKDFIEKLDYIHNNPVKKGLVKDPGKYEFSSYHQLYGELRERVYIPIDKILL